MVKLLLSYYVILLLSVTTTLTLAQLDKAKVEPKVQLFPVPPSTECKSGTSEGLLPILDEFHQLFPLLRFANYVIYTLRENVEFYELILEIQEHSFSELSERITKMPEWNELLNYFCDEHKYNLRFYLQTLAEVFQLEPEPIAAESHIEGPRPTLISFRDTITEFIPFEEWQQLLANKITKNLYARKAVNKLKSDSFRAIAETIEKSNDFEFLLKIAEQRFEIPAKCLVEKTKKYLGWKHNTCVCTDLVSDDPNEQFCEKI